MNKAKSIAEKWVSRILAQEATSKEEMISGLTNDIEALLDETRSEWTVNINSPVVHRVELDSKLIEKKITEALIKVLNKTKIVQP